MAQVIQPLHCHERNLKCIPGFQLLPNIALAVVGIFGVNQKKGHSMSASVSLPFKKNTFSIFILYVGIKCMLHKWQT